MGQGRSETGGSGHLRNTQFVTKDELAIEMDRLRANIQGMFDSIRPATTEIPDPIFKEEMSIIPIIATVPERCDYKMFLSCKPPTYSGKEDQVEAMKWLKEMEAIFKTIKCAEGDQVLYGTAMLKDNALHWWKAFITSKGPDVYATISWEDFVIHFKGRFCPQAVVRLLEEEFMNLHQGNSSVRDYTARFLKKSRFDECYVAEETLKMERFIFGLNSKIGGLVIAKGPDTFSAAVELAEKIERGKERNVNENSFGKRKVEEMMYDSKEYESPRFINFLPFRPAERRCLKGDCIQQENRQVDYRVCFRCGRTGHVVKDCRVKRLCFLCNSPDHIQSDCPRERVQQSGMLARPTGVRSVVPKPELPRTRGRAFRMTAQGEEEVSDEVTGMFLINSIRAKVLF